MCLNCLNNVVMLMLQEAVDIVADCMAEGADVAADTLAEVASIRWLRTTAGGKCDDITVTVCFRKGSLNSAGCAQRYVNCN